MQIARSAIDLDDFLTASRSLTSCQQASPANAEASFLQARLERRASDPHKASECLQQARRLGWPTEEVEFEEMLLQAQNGGALQLAPRLQALIVSDPSKAALASEALVRGLIQSRAIEDAHVACDAWVSRSPEDWRAHFWLAWILEAEGYGPLALEEYRQASEANPNNSGVRFRLAEALLNVSDYPLALPQLRSCLQSRPDDPGVRFAMARCLQALGKNDEAESILQALVGENGRDGRVPLLLARMRLDSEDSARAVEWARRAVELDPANAVAAATLAEALRGVQSKEASVWEEKARALTEQNERIASLTREARYHARDVEAQYQLGSLLLSMGRQAEASYWLRRALQVDSTHQPTREALAKISASGGQPASLPKTEPLRDAAKQPTSP